MTDKEIEQALQDMAVTTNWGSVERIGATNSDVNAVPKNIAIIQETLAYIDRLKAENEKLLNNLSQILCTVDITDYLHSSRIDSIKDQAHKETARACMRIVKHELSQAQSDELKLSLRFILGEIAIEYGVEVEE